MRWRIKMLIGVVIAGDSRRFLLEAMDLRKYLNGIGKLFVSTVKKTAYINKNELYAYLRAVLATLTEQDVALVSFHGHGHCGGWQINDAERLSYRALSHLFKSCRGKIIFINDCCHAAAIIPYLEARNVDKNRFSLISACASEELTAPGIVRDIIFSWNYSQIFIERIINAPDAWKNQKKIFRERWGAELDFYFFGLPKR